jgi:hypothetical protein
MVLLSLIVMALMTVFSSTQALFRASITQADVLGGGRSVMGLLKGDFESMTPSVSYSNGAVNLCVVTNQWQYQSNAAPLVQSLVGAGSTTTQRTNVVETVFILTRQNTTWTGIGYVVDTASTNYLNPLYRFSMNTNVAINPWWLFYFFTNTVATNGFANLSHLADGVVHLTVRPYDPNGRWMTNFHTIYPSGTNLSVNFSNANQNAWFSAPQLGEVSFYLYSNTLPASVQVELGMLEDRAIQRAESLPDAVRSNYLAQQSGKVHLFRQRIPIRNVDPSAYQ